jgi:hypothetical protein
MNRFTPPFALFIANSILIQVLNKPRSFGGDFWLHLWLIEQQRVSWKTYSNPALLVSFDPVGDLSIVSLFSGGFFYSILGLIANLGIFLYTAALIGFLIAINVAMVSTYFLSKTITENIYHSILVTATLFAFSWIFGDGFGRGALSSMVAGLFSISSLNLILRWVVSQKKLTGIFDYLSIFSTFFISFSTHLPSFIILISFGLPLIFLLIIVLRVQGIKVATNFKIPIFFALTASAMYWYIPILWSRNSNFNSKIDDLISISQPFVNFKNLFSLKPIIPTSHYEAWASFVGEKFIQPTSLFVTQPVLLIITILMATLFLSLNGLNQKNHILVYIMIYLLTYLFIMAPAVFNFFPSIFANLQYSFRFLYIPIPFFIVIASYTFREIEKRGYGPKSIYVILFCVILFFQMNVTINQINKTTNISISDYRNPGFFEWTYDVDPKFVTAHSPSAPFWYARDQYSRDSIGLIQDLNTTCKGDISTERIGSWPGAEFSPIKPNSLCHQIPLSLPTSWVEFTENEIYSRNGDTFSIVVTNINGQSEIRISRSIYNPLVQGLVISGLGLLFNLLFIIKQMKLKIRRN